LQPLTNFKRSNPRSRVSSFFKDSKGAFDRNFAAQGFINKDKISIHFERKGNGFAFPWAKLCKA